MRSLLNANIVVNIKPHVLCLTFSDQVIAFMCDCTSFACGFGCPANENVPLSDVCKPSTASQ